MIISCTLHNAVVVCDKDTLIYDGGDHHRRRALQMHVRCHFPLQMCVQRPNNLSGRVRHLQTTNALAFYFI